MYSFLIHNIHKAEALNNINMHEILKKLEELYSNNLVYRTIIVCKNIEDSKNILNTNNYNAYVIDKYDNINYDSLDTRIFLIEKDNFIKFIKDSIDNENPYGSDFYNVVIFDSKGSNDHGNLKKEFKKICNKDIIIF
jgi:hypothetical protein